MFPVIKANAYGHGLKQITEILDRTDAKYLVVDSFPEYKIVSKHTDKKILVLGETLPENYKKFDRKKVTFCVYNMKVLEILADREEPVTVHLFLNTGMYREGIDEHQIGPVVKFCMQHPHITIEGVLSHFHSADVLGTYSMDEQITKFKAMYYQILNAGLTPAYRYIANSAGTLKMKDDFFNACRPGLALYGYNPLQPSDEFYDNGRKLKPALSITSRLIAMHDVPAGQ
ncbi:alanine racemase [Patescibacteria group bacterium]|nr:alanine racemase [Patescibacteria group bacterium]